MEDKRTGYILWGLMGVISLYILCSWLGIFGGGGKMSPDHKHSAEILGGNKLVIGDVPPGMFSPQPCLEVAGEIKTIVWKSNRELSVVLSPGSTFKYNLASKLGFVLDIQKN